METREATKTNNADVERWNNQSKRERQYWLTLANSARPIDAWRVFKRFKHTEIDPKSWTPQ